MSETASIKGVSGSDHTLDKQEIDLAMTYYYHYNVCQVPLLQLF